MPARFQTTAALRSAAAALAVAAILAACDTAGSSGPLDASGGGLTDGTAPGDSYLGPPRGEWKGDHVNFTLTEDGIVDIELHDVFCKSALHHCESAAEAATFPSGLSVEQRSNADGTTEWHVVGDLGPLTKIDGLLMPIDATPAAFTNIQGTYIYAPDDCACDKTMGFWKSSFVPPKDPNDPDASGGDTGDDPGGTYPDDATPQQIKALERVNHYRKLVGVPTVDMLANINQMSTDHCACYSQHLSEYNSTGMSPHDESSAWPEPCYGGLGERMAAHGVQGGASEVMAFMNNPVGAVDGWIATLYHRLPLTDPGTKSIGYGAANQCDTINTTGTGGASTWEVVYPYDGQQDADTDWNGAESPQPPPPPTGYPSGPIITLQFGAGVTFTIEDNVDVLVDENGNPVSHTMLNPKNDSNLAGSSTVCVYADDPLMPDTTYTVTLTGTRVNQPWNKTWSFKTGAGNGGGVWP